MYPDSARTIYYPADADFDNLPISYVRSWLSSAFPPGYLQIPVYCKAFVAGGWGTRAALKRIEKADLDKMGVKEGHARMILLRLKQE